MDRDNADAVAAAYRELFLAAGGGGLGRLRRFRVFAPFMKGSSKLDERGDPAHAQHVDAMDIGTLVDIFPPTTRLASWRRRGAGRSTQGGEPEADCRSGALAPAGYSSQGPPQGLWRKLYDERLVRLKIVRWYGRLIRRAEDRGVFVMLDRRMPSALEPPFRRGASVSHGLKAALELRAFRRRPLGLGPIKARRGGFARSRPPPRGGADGRSVFRLGMGDLRLERHLPTDTSGERSPAVILVVRGMAAIDGHTLDIDGGPPVPAALETRPWGFGLRWIYLNRAQPEWIVKRPMATIRAPTRRATHWASNHPIATMCRTPRPRHADGDQRRREAEAERADTRPLGQNRSAQTKDRDRNRRGQGISPPPSRRKWFAKWSTDRPLQNVFEFPPRGRGHGRRRGRVRSL